MVQTALAETERVETEMVETEMVEREMVESVVTQTTRGDAERYETLAADRRTRARRIRRRAAEISPELAPLRHAMCRRAAELELSAAALGEIAAGQAAAAANR